MPEAWRGATCGPWPSNRHSGWCACVCVGVCGLNLMRRSINFAGTHSSHPPLSLATLFLSLILFNIFSATSASLSLHAMIPSCPHTPSLALLQSVPNSIFAFAFALFIYLFIVMLVYCFAFDCLRRLLAKGCGQHFWLYIRIRPLSFMGKKLKLILFDM